MKKQLPVIAFSVVLVLALAALVASAVLFVDYVRPQPVFCDPEGGCGIVKRTVFAYPFGVTWLPMPAIGIGGVLAITFASIVSGKRARTAQAMLAVFGAMVATGLLVVQALLHVVCPYCAVVDVASLLIAALSVLRAVKGWDPPPSKRLAFILAGGALASALVPIGLGFAKKPLPSPLPDVVAEEIHKTGPGRVTIVDFADFECPWCRKTHAVLEPLVEAHKDKIRVARKNVPLRVHPHSMDAARAACCATDAGHGDAMAEALFAADDLTKEGCERLAAQQGLDVEAFRACVASPATDAKIHADTQAFRDSHAHGLPTIFIDEQRFEGAQDQATLKAALDAALKTL